MFLSDLLLSSSGFSLLMNLLILHVCWFLLLAHQPEFSIRVQDGSDHGLRSLLGLAQKLGSSTASVIVCLQTNQFQLPEPQYSQAWGKVLWSLQHLA